MQIDSTKTIHQTPINPTSSKTLSKDVVQAKDKTTIKTNTTHIERQLQAKELVNSESVSVPVQENTYKPFGIFENQNQGDSSIYHPKTAFTLFKEKKQVGTDYQIMNRAVDKSREKNWVFGLATFITVLLLIVFIYFNRQLKAVISAFFNIQLSDKLTREKNVMLKRFFWLLNINFLIAISLYFYIAVQHVFNSNTEWSQLKLFSLILVIALSVLLFRYILLLILGYVFDSYQLFKEFIYNSYILYKNLGLYILPLVLSYFFVPEGLKDTLFYISTVLLILLILYRYLRSTQIILKHKVLYFYTILYLCTLEILPALVGFKFVLSLR